MNNEIIISDVSSEPSLIVYTKQQKHIKKEAIKKYMVVGRRTDDTHVDIDFHAGFVSRRHGIIEFSDGNYYYLDNRSANGTYLNGVKLKPEKRSLLKNGDVLQVFQWEGREIIDVVTAVFTTEYPEHFTTKRYSIEEDFTEILVGNSGEEKDVRFYRAQRGMAVADCSLTRQVRLNGESFEKPKYLRIGDCVQIRNLCFFYDGESIIYQHPEKKQVISDAASDVLAIDIHERNVMQHGKKLTLLKDIQLQVNPGEMVLILGGSGAGKTTFMNAVMGYEKADGKILLGQTDVYADYEAVKKQIGFVPQQDLVRGSNTVFNTLESAAEMKLPATMSKAEKRKRVEDVLKTFSLWEVREHLVSKLAGGQRKRVSVAVEYIANPSLFFLDEPDSGLDGPEASKLMQNLRRIADEGKIVMVISHIPDRASNLFDKVLVLAKSKVSQCGHLAFYGTVREAFTYFDTETLEGVVKRINTDGLSDFYIEKYKSTI